MNDFLIAAKELIYKNGIPVKYKSVTKGVYYTKTSKVANTEEEFQIKAFPKKMNITQYNYPNLIGKDVINFMVWALDVNPKVNDYIVHNDLKYIVVEVKPHYAEGTTIFYHVICSK